MLYLIPAPLHRLALRWGYRLRRVWWRLARPQLSGVAVIGLDEAGRVLLVRLSYGSQVWSLPAGGIARGEDATAAARREFAEEIGCQLADLRFLGASEEQLHGASDSVQIFTGHLVGEPRPDQREVIEARFFAPDALPKPLEKSVAGRLALLDEVRPSS